MSLLMSLSWRLLRLRFLAERKKGHSQLGNWCVELLQSTNKPLHTHSGGLPVVTAPFQCTLTMIREATSEFDWVSFLLSPIDGCLPCF